MATFKIEVGVLLIDTPFAVCGVNEALKENAFGKGLGPNDIPIEVWKVMRDLG